MVRLINATTGTDMWVANERLNEYMAAGHKPAADATEAQSDAKTAPAKTAKKKTAKK